MDINKIRESVMKELLDVNALTAPRRLVIRRIRNEIKEEIKNCIVHSPYFHTAKDCCRVRDDVMQIIDKHITKIEEEENA